MTGSSQRDAPGPPGPPGQSVERHEDVLADVEQLIAALQAHPDPDVRVHVTALLQGIDAVHRTALTHLVGAIASMGGQAFLNRLTADPAIRLLLMSYDLLAVDRRLLAEEAIDAARGHLHGHGIDVELLDVVGGVVYVRLHGLGRRGIAPEAVLRDLRTALREGLAGFQEVVVREREPASLIQLAGVRRPNRPVYRQVASAVDLHDGEIIGVSVDGLAIALARVNGEVFAVSDRCGDTPLPLHFSTLRGHVIECSWHGCLYDVRTGDRADDHADASAERALGARLAVYPVRESDGGIMVAVGVEPLERGAAEV